MKLSLFLGLLVPPLPRQRQCGPTELLPDNGTRLRGILRELAENQVPDVGFLPWLETANTVCNSLVDRIVPGRLDAAASTALAQELGCEHKLLTMSEVYAPWAIEGDERVQQALSFQAVHPGSMVQPDINQFRELRRRLLNGTHSLAALYYRARYAPCPGRQNQLQHQAGRAHAR